MKVALAARMNPAQGAAMWQGAGGAVGALRQQATQVLRGGAPDQQQKQPNGQPFLQSLTEQRDYLTQKRDELTGKLGAATEADSKHLAARIEQLDEQLGELDQLIAEQSLQAQQKALEEKKAEQPAEKPLTEEEQHQRQMAEISQARISFDTMQLLRTTAAQLKSSAGLQAQFAENDGFATPSRAAALQKLDAGVSGLENAGRTLLADAQASAEQVQTGDEPPDDKLTPLEAALEANDPTHEQD